MSAWGRVRPGRAWCVELAGLISVVTRQGFHTDGTKISLGINIPIKIKQPKKLNQLNSHYCELQDLPVFPKQKQQGFVSLLLIALLVQCTQQFYWGSPSRCIQVYSLWEEGVAAKPSWTDLGWNSLYEQLSEITMCKDILQPVFIYSRAGRSRLLLSDWARRISSANTRIPPRTSGMSRGNSRLPCKAPNLLWTSASNSGPDLGMLSP